MKETPPLKTMCFGTTTPIRAETERYHDTTENPLYVPGLRPARPGVMGGVDEFGRRYAVSAHGAPAKKHEGKNGERKQETREYFEPGKGGRGVGRYVDR